MQRSKAGAWISRILIDKSADFMQKEDTANLEINATENMKNVSDSPMALTPVRDVVTKGTKLLSVR